MTQTTIEPTPPAPPPPHEESAWRRGPYGPILLLWIVISAVLVVFGAIVPSRLLGPAASPEMREIKSTVTAFTIAAAPVAGLVWAIALYSLFRWRYKGKEPPPEGAPPLRRNSKVESTWVAVTSALCLFLLVWGLVVSQPAGARSVPVNPMTVGVTGNQWTWNFTYPRNGNIQSDQLYLPLNVPVQFNVSSKDVNHSFWIVEMGVKVDANNSEITHVSVTPDRLGTYTVKCAELCGIYHSYMETEVHVVSPADFAVWVRANGGSIA